MRMRAPIVAAVTIGRSPRPDMVGDLAAKLPGVEWVEAGALDGLDEAAVDALRPEPGDVPLVTRAGDRSVVVGERAVTPLVQAALDRSAAGADAVVVLCASEFVGLFAPPPIVRPGAVLDGVAASLAVGRRLNVFVPHEGQIERQRERWHRRRLPVHVTAVAPDDHTDLEGAGRRAAGTGDLTILDCTGFTLAHEQRVRAGAGHPVLSARGIAIRVLQALLGLP